MVEVDWYDLADTDFYGGSIEEGVSILPAEHVGVMACEEETFGDFFEQLFSRVKGMSGMEVLYVDFREAVSSEDYQQRIIDAIKTFLKDRGDETEMKGDAPAEIATSALELAEVVAKHLKKNFLLVMDLRNIQFDASVFRPGQKFWWVYNIAMKAEGNRRVWFIDCDEDIFNMLSDHGQMGKIFSEEGTDLFMIV